MPPDATSSTMRQLPILSSIVAARVGAGLRDVEISRRKLCAFGALSSSRETARREKTRPAEKNRGGVDAAMPRPYTSLPRRRHTRVTAARRTEEQWLPERSVSE